MTFVFFKGDGFGFDIDWLLWVINYFEFKLAYYRSIRKFSNSVDGALDVLVLVKYTYWDWERINCGKNCYKNIVYASYRNVSWPILARSMKFNQKLILLLKWLNRKIPNLSRLNLSKAIIFLSFSQNGSNKESDIINDERRFFVVSNSQSPTKILPRFSLFFCHKISDTMQTSNCIVIQFFFVYCRVEKGQ